jgi:tetratricopeptide (TPR) repeat protein
MGDRYGEAITLTGLGRLYRETGQYDDALYCLADALDVRHASGDPLGEAITLEELGNTHRDLGRIGDASDHYRRALAWYEQNGSPRDVERVTSKIARLTGEDC